MKQYGYRDYCAFDHAVLRHTRKCWSFRCVYLIPWVDFDPLLKESELVAGYAVAFGVIGTTQSLSDDPANAQEQRNKGTTGESACQR